MLFLHELYYNEMKYTGFIKDITANGFDLTLAGLLSERLVSLNVETVLRYRYCAMHVNN